MGLEPTNKGISQLNVLPVLTTGEQPQPHALALPVSSIPDGGSITWDDSATWDDGDTWQE